MYVLYDQRGTLGRHCVISRHQQIALQNAMQLLSVTQEKSFDLSSVHERCVGEHTDLVSNIRP